MSIELMLADKSFYWCYVNDKLPVHSLRNYMMPINAADSILLLKKKNVKEKKKISFKEEEEKEKGEAVFYTYWSSSSPFCRQLVTTQLRLKTGKWLPMGKRWASWSPCYLTRTENWIMNWHNWRSELALLHENCHPLFLKIFVFKIHRNAWI